MMYRAACKSLVSTIQSVVLTADVFHFFIEQKRHPVSLFLDANVKYVVILVGSERRGKRMWMYVSSYNGNREGASHAGRYAAAAGDPSWLHGSSGTEREAGGIDREGEL